MEGLNSVQKVRFLTMNMYMLPPLAPGKYKNKRLNMFAETQLDNYDICWFQEIFHFPLSSRRKRMIQHGIAHGFEYSAFSPMPNPFKNGKIGCGGLLTISRYPIIDTRFESFQASYSSDSMANKGILYSKIQLPSSYDNTQETQYLHLFQMHTQASYFDPTASNDYVNSFVVRNLQLLQARQFIHNTLFGEHQIGQTDLALLWGDFNVNSAPLSKIESQIKESIVVENWMIMNFVNDEYRNSLLSALSNDMYWNVKDCLRDSILGGNKLFSPITYADAAIDEETGQYIVDSDSGEHINCCPSLIPPSDALLKMSLDYIFELKIKNQQSKELQQFYVDIDQTHVERMNVRDQPFEQLSDHFGIATQLVRNQDNS